MTDKEALECARKLKQYCEGKESCDGCLFHDVSGSWYVCKLEDQADSWELPEEGRS